LLGILEWETPGFSKKYQIRTGKESLGQVRPGNVKLDQFRLGLLRLGQVRHI